MRKVNKCDVAGDEVRFRRVRVHVHKHGHNSDQRRKRISRHSHPLVDGGEYYVLAKDLFHAQNINVSDSRDKADGWFLPRLQEMSPLLVAS